MALNKQFVYNELFVNLDTGTFVRWVFGTTTTDVIDGLYTNQHMWADNCLD